MSMPIVKAYPSDLGGCGMYRMIWPGQVLERANVGVEVIMPDAPDDQQIQAVWHEDVLTRQQTLVDIVHPEADVVVLQRPLKDYLAAGIPMLQAKGVRVVVEIDDDFDAISPRNVSWSAVDPAKHPTRNRDWLRAACAVADLVVCSTPALAKRYAPHGRFRIVRNRVPAWYLSIEREPHEGVYVGWTGSIETHPDDLQVTGGGVARAIRQTGAAFAVVGTGKGVRKALGLPADPVACGWVPIGRYPYMIAELDVGIVPLELTPFNQAKSALKLSEMAACGVVPIVSPTDENLRMAAAVDALVAESPRQWEGLVKRLVRDADWRAERAHLARTAMQDHTIEGNAVEWYDAWTAPVNTPAKGSAA
jgi:hypothetical protein